MPEPAADIIIRPATPGDAAFVLGLVPQLAAFGPPPWRSVEQMVETDSLVLGSALDGSTAGATVPDRRGPRRPPARFHSPHQRHRLLHAVRVRTSPTSSSRPRARGRGVGERPLAAGEQWAASCGYSLLTLNVFMENQSARSLYERTGYGAETVRIKDLKRRRG